MYYQIVSLNLNSIIGVNLILFQQENAHICRSCAPFCQINTHALNHITCLSKTGCIEKSYRMAGDIQTSLDNVPGRASIFRYQRDISST